MQRLNPPLVETQWDLSVSTRTCTHLPDGAARRHAASFAGGIDGHCYRGWSCPSEPINILLCPRDHLTHPLRPSCG